MSDPMEIDDVPRRPVLPFPLFSQTGLPRRLPDPDTVVQPPRLEIDDVPRLPVHPAPLFSQTGLPRRLPDPDTVLQPSPFASLGLPPEATRPPVFIAGFGPSGFEFEGRDYARQLWDIYWDIYFSNSRSDAMEIDDVPQLDDMPEFIRNALPEFIRNAYPEYIRNASDPLPVFL